MTVAPMTSRERWLAALDLRPVDRLPFWPKLGPAFPPGQAASFAEITLPEIHEWVGSNQLVTVPAGLQETYAPGLAAPKTVRYAWHDNPVCSLFNQENLPATPFHIEINHNSTKENRP